VPTQILDTLTPVGPSRAYSISQPRLPSASRADPADVLITVPAPESLTASMSGNNILPARAWLQAGGVVTGRCSRRLQGGRRQRSWRLHSQRTDAAISSPWPRRPIGIAAVASARSSSPLAAMSATIGVSMVPGQTALIRIPRGAYSRPALVVGPITPCFAAV
jgi:hypothetical protein